MAGKKKHHEEEEGGEAWLLPYSDLMTLLLAVFIVLFAVSKVDNAKAEEMAVSFSGIMTGGTSVLNSDGMSVIPLYVDTIPDDGKSGEGEGEAGEKQNIDDLISREDLSDLEQVQTELQDYFDTVGLDREVTMHIDERGLVVSLSSTLLFDSGSAEINEENAVELLAIADTIKKVDNYIRIEGHTDNIPISTSVYPSNWELSTARAARVVKLFAEQGNINPEKMVVTGYAEYKPVADNSTPEGRAENRRIDIIILNKKYNSLEDQIEDVTVIE